MTLEIGFLFVLLAVMVVLFLTEKLPVDLTAFAGLVVLVFAGYVEPEEAFAGFSSPAVITMLSVFFVSAALQYTGVARALGARIHGVMGSREIPLISAIMLVGGLLSAFMNNIAAAAVLMPAVASLSRQAGVAPSRMMMPLAFGCILGGTTTLVGTPPNLLTSQVLTEQGLEPFALFDFAPYGLALLGGGVLFMVTLGRKLLPAGNAGMAEVERADLAGVYRIGERLFSLQLQPGSPLAGQTLRQARFGDALGVQVVAIVRDGQEQLVPPAHEVLHVGDRLVVEGRRDEVEARLDLRSLEVHGLGALPVTSSLAGGVVVRLRDGSPLLGRSLKSLNFRRHHRVAVAALWREGVRLEELGDQALERGDEILALGEPHRVHELANRPDLDVVVEGPEALHRLESALFVLNIPGASPLAGATIASSQLRERFDLTVVGLIRDGETEMVIAPDTALRAGDQLLVAGRPTRILQLLNVGNVEVAREDSHRSLETDDVGLVEAVVAPRSAAVGRSLRDLDFRNRYGLRALALWRGARPVRSGLPDLKLRLGDGLLLHGPREKEPLLHSDPDFVVLSAPTASAPLRPRQAPFALAALLLMVGLVVARVFPIQVAAFAAATLVVLMRALTMHEAYRAVEWRAVFLVAAILPVGVAMERTGAAELVANSVANLAGGAGPYAVLIALMVISSLLSQGLDGAPTVVLLGPVVVGTAQQLGLSPYPLMMGVGLAASAAFMTPFSHKANLLVMGAGGYRAVDYAKVGAPLTLFVLGLLTVMIPLLMPFRP
jgi:di/tricarboxylate transporter